MGAPRVGVGADFTPQVNKPKDFYYDICAGQRMIVYGHCIPRPQITKIYKPPKWGIVQQYVFYLNSASETKDCCSQSDRMFQTLAKK